MYDLPQYKEADPEVIKQFIKENPFAFLSGADAQNHPVMTQVPVFLEEENGKQFLRGHIMKNTDHHKAFLHNANVLVVFTGPHCYVSGTWYSDPHTASTWNYISVHVKGQIKFLDQEGLIEILRKTTLHFEGYNKQSTTIFDNLTKEYTHKLMPAIAGFEIEVTSMDNVYKLSQNRDQESYLNIKKKLAEQEGDALVIAREMEKRTDQLFPE
jgi:transcriptional regulator